MTEEVTEDWAAQIIRDYEAENEFMARTIARNQEWAQENRRFMDSRLHDVRLLVERGNVFAAAKEISKISNASWRMHARLQDSLNRDLRELNQRRGQAPEEEVPF